MSLLAADAGRVVLAMTIAVIVGARGLPTEAAANSAATASAIVTTTTLQLPSHQLLATTYMEFSATVDPVPATGEVTVYDVAGGGHVRVGINLVEPTGLAWFLVTGSALGVGHHELVAEYIDPVGTYEPSTSAPQSLDVVKAPASLSLSASGTTMLPGDSITLTASTTAAYAGVQVTFTAVGPNGAAVLGSGGLRYDGPDYRIELVVDSLALGSYAITATLAESELTTGATSNTVTITATKRPTMTTIVPMGTHETHHPFEIYVYPTAAVPADGLPVPTGTVTLSDGPISLGTKPLDNGLAIYQVSSFTAGTHTLRASYTGDGHYASSTKVEALVISPDTVHASNVGIDLAQFYPVIDGYRDTLNVRGTRNEPASVSIRISGPSGATVRTAAFGLGTGAYAFKWDGRDAKGVLLPASSYAIVQTLTDSASTKKTVTSYVFLSGKKLVTKTAYVTRDGSAVTAKGSGSGGTVTVSTSGHYVKLVGGTGWASAGWEFSIPAAVVYKSVAVEINAQAGFSVPPSQVGVQNFGLCPRTSDWEVSCFDRWTNVGDPARSKRWYSTAASASTAYRSSKYVRGIISVDYGTVYVYQARAKVVYQVFEVPVGIVLVTR